MLQQAPLLTGTAKVVVYEAKDGLPAALALNGTSNIVFPATYNGDVDAPRLGGTAAAICGMDDPANPGNAIMTTCPRLGRSQGELFPNFMAVVAGRAYWVDGSNVKSEMIANVGTTFDAVSTTINGSITAAFATADSIYFGEDGFVEKAPTTVNTTNAPPILIARAQKAPSSIFVDATKVYWATGDCAITELAPADLSVSRSSAARAAGAFIRGRRPQRRPAIAHAEQRNGWPPRGHEDRDPSCREPRHEHLPADENEHEAEARPGGGLHRPSGRGERPQPEDGEDVRRGEQWCGRSRDGRRWRDRVDGEDDVGRLDGDEHEEERRRVAPAGLDDGEASAAIVAHRWNESAEITAGSRFRSGWTSPARCATA